MFFNIRRLFFISILALQIFSHICFSTPKTYVIVNPGQENALVAIIDSIIHQDYRLSYPLTWQLSILGGSSNLKAYRKFTTKQTWTEVTEKTDTTFYNAIEAVCFDYEKRRAYLSVTFNNYSDSIFFKITDHNIESFFTTYQGISQHYDNRNDAVTCCSSDDWAVWCDAKFVRACNEFQNRAK